MAIMKEELAARIQSARNSAGMTQDAVAKHLGLSRSTIAQIESARRSVTSLELGALAFLFGRDMREFVAESFQEEDTLAAMFRAQVDDDDQNLIMEHLRGCVSIGREFTSLEHLLGVDRELSAVATYPLPVPCNRWEAIQHGERVADEERRRLGLGNGPLPDVAELLETQGARAGLLGLPDDVSGLTLNDRSMGLFVVVNRTHHLYRRRFSFAHEYAHVALDQARPGIISRASDRNELLEIRANAFAANFLMPEAGVRQFLARLGKGKPSRVHREVFDEAGSLDVEGRTVPGTQLVQLYDVVQLAHHFVVSRTAMLYRLLNLRLLAQPAFQSLKALDDAGKGKELAEQLGLPEPGHDESRRLFSHRFIGLALEAYRREEISRSKLGELAAMVNITIDVLDQLIEITGIDNNPSGDGDR